jgi:hypothetical protein
VPTALLASLYAVALVVALAAPGQHLVAAVVVAAGLASRAAVLFRRRRATRPAVAPLDPAVALS